MVLHNSAADQDQNHFFILLYKTIIIGIRIKKIKKNIPGSKKIRHCIINCLPVVGLVRNPGCAVLDENWQQGARG